MTKTHSYYTASKKSKIAIAAVEGKLTQAQIRSEYDVTINLAEVLTILS